MAAEVEVGRLAVKVSPDSKQFRRELKAELDYVEKRFNAQIKVTADLDAASAKTQMHATMDNLKAIAAHGVEVNVDLDRNRLQRLTSDVTKEMDKAGKSMSSRLSESLSGGGGGGIAGTGALVAGVVSLIAPALALASTALATLPGLITAVAVPVGALALGVDGLKKAAEQLKPPLDQLKATMSKATQDTFTPVLAKLKPLFPVLEAALPSATQGLGKMADSLVSTVTSGDGMRKILGTIQGIAAGLTAAAPGVGSFTSGILGMAEQLSQKLPAVGKWFSDIGTQFSAWVQKATADGSLSSAFDNLGTTLKMIVDIVGDLAGKGIKLMSDPQMMTDIKTFLADLQAIANIAIPIAKAGFTSLAGIVGMVRGALESAKMTFDALVSAATFLPKALMNTDWSAIWSGLKETASETWGAVKAAASEAWSTLVSGLTNAVGQIVSTVSELPGKVTAALAGMGKAGLDAGIQLVQGMINGVGSLVGSLVDKVRGLAASAVDAAKSALGIHSPSRVFQAIGEYTGQGLVNGLESKQDAVSAAADKLADLTKSSFEEFQDAGKTVMGVPFDFATSTADQFLGDIGISGEGALSQFAKGSLDMVKNAALDAILPGKESGPPGNSYVFNVSNIDEAMSLKDREDSKRARTYIGR